MYEILKERKLNTKVFFNDKGIKTVRVFSDPVHYYDTLKNEYKEIDNTIYLCNDSMGCDYHTVFNDFTVEFKKDISLSESVKYKRNGGKDGSVSFTLIGLYLYNDETDEKFLIEKAQHSIGEVNGRKIIFKNVFTGVDIEYTVNSIGLKEDVIFHSGIKTIIPDSTSINFEPSKTRVVVLMQLSSLYGIDLMGDTICIMGEGDAYSWLDQVISKTAIDKTINSFSKFNDTSNEYTFGISYEDVYKSNYPILIDPTVLSSVSENYYITRVNSDPSPAVFGNTLQVGYESYTVVDDKGEVETAEYRHDSYFKFTYNKLPYTTIGNFKVGYYFTQLKDSFSGYHSEMKANQYNYIPRNTDEATSIVLPHNGKVGISYIDNNTHPAILEHTEYTVLILNPIKSNERSLTISWVNSGGLKSGEKHRIYYTLGTNLTAEQIIQNGVYTSTESHTDVYKTFIMPSDGNYCFVVVDEQIDNRLGTYSNVQEGSTTGGSQTDSFNIYKVADNSLISTIGDLANPIAFELKTNLNESKEQRLCIKSTAGRSVSDTTIKFQGTSSERWQLAQDNNGVSGTYLDPLSPLIIGTVGGVAGQTIYFWVKASSNATEMLGDDTSVVVTVLGIVSEF